MKERDFFMTTLEATVEIVKAVVSTSSASSSYLLTDEIHRTNFLKGIENLYKKLEEIDSMSSGG